MKIAVVRSVEIENGVDNFKDGTSYVFAGVFDEAAAAVLAKIAIPSDLPGWVASGMAGRPMFKVGVGDLKGLDDVGRLIEGVLASIEEAAK